MARSVAEPTRSPTLATVAAAAGVSRMTVSNAFNHPDRLSAALRERVLATAAELGYAGPNPIARTLSRGETGAIGLIFDYGLTLALTDPAMVMLLHGVAAVCEEREMGLSLVPRFSGRDAAQVRTALVDGFVLYSVTDADPRLAAVRERRLPYALIDYDPGEELVVTVDDRAAARQMADHLVALGHRRIAIVLGWESASSLAAEADRAAWHTVRARMAGWREGIEAAGIDFDASLVASGPGFDRETGRVAGARLLDRADRPTAVLAISDLLALGVLDAAAERGVNVPRDLSVIGFDDIPDAATSTPPLTTVRQPHREKGSTAVQLLLTGVKAPHTVLLPTELVVRSSTGPLTT
jgi:DNA-binding LacI/PurR family transcriptional regulator